MGSLYPVDSENERDRYFNEGTVTRDLLDSIKDNIVDFASFKEKLTKAFNDDISLRGLIKAFEERGDADFKVLFNHPLVQEWITKNRPEEIIIQGIMEKSKLSRINAKEKFDGMPADQKDRLISRIVKDMTVKVRPPKEPVEVKRIVKISQVAASGTSYKRTKPQRWSIIQSRFLIHNRFKSKKDIFETYNSLFPEMPRTFRSIKNKIYRTFK